MRTRSQIAESRRNLARRPTTPARGNGKVQRMARRALLALGAANTSEILTWTCSGKLHRGERLANHDNRAARRALDRIADRVGRAATIGRPWIWRLKDMSSSTNDDKSVG
jgi:hypothetical protein